MIAPSDTATLRAKLSEMLSKFNELSIEMAAQRHTIDQLVSNSNSVIRNNHIPFDSNQPELDNQSSHISNIQTTFVPPFTNPPKGAITYLNHSLPHSHPSYILVNLTNNQISQN